MKINSVFKQSVFSSFLALLIIPNSVLCQPYYFGADLSFVNELEDCGTKYKSNGKEIDPYKAFAETGTNLVRIRIWNSPDWTKYSQLSDVEKSLSRAKSNGMQTLLDFHYSDDWADGEKQIAPKAWENLSTEEQAEALYKYTYDVLTTLNAKGLLPDMVQVGNETNGEIISNLENSKKPINWARNATLFNAGIKAVRDATKGVKNKPKIMLHIAQPENVEPWFKSATEAGISDFDVIGISYYKKWSKFSLAELSGVIRRTHEKYNKEVVIVETGYPFTLGSNDNSTNLIGEDSIIAGYVASPEGQKKYMQDLMQLTLDNGGSGVVYWEPAWVSSKCKTRWGQGSSWENVAFFDFNNQTLPALKWPQYNYILPMEITFKTPAKSNETSMYFGADFLAGEIVKMKRVGDFFEYRTHLRPDSNVTFGANPKLEDLENSSSIEVKINLKNSVVIF